VNCLAHDRANINARQNKPHQPCCIIPPVNFHMAMNNMKSLTLAGLGAVFLCAGCAWMGGEFRGAPAEMDANISDGAKGLLAQASL